jgi:hypothetical protein
LASSMASSPDAASSRPMIRPIAPARKR